MKNNHDLRDVQSRFKHIRSESGNNKRKKKLGEMRQKFQKFNIFVAH